MCAPVFNIKTIKIEKVKAVLNSKVISFDSIDSTNDFLRRNWRKLNNFTICWALTQTKGKGRNGRSWFSPKGGLWFSILFKPRKIFSDVNLYTKISSIALCKFFEKLNLEPIIKWPNDIYIKRKKIAGILTETIFGESNVAVIVGIGVNINNDIPSELRDKAVSLKQITDREYNLHITLRKIVGYIFRIYNLRSKKTGIATIIKMWKKRLFPKEGEEIKVMLNDEIHKVKVLKIFENYIEVLNDKRILKINSGEITE